MRYAEVLCDVSRAPKGNRVTAEKNVSEPAQTVSVFDQADGRLGVLPPPIPSDDTSLEQAIDAT